VKGCIRCHMPGVRVASAHRELTDHYIRLSHPAKAQAGGAASNSAP